MRKRREGAGLFGVRSVVPAIGLAAALSLFAVPPASAVERVTDGGFEGTVCPSGNPLPPCTNANWTLLDTPSAYILFCRTDSTRCTSTDVGPATGLAWVSWRQLGAVTSAIEQTIAIPGAPATLSFKIGQGHFSPPDPVTMTASIDGVPVAVRDQTSTSGGGFTTVTVDVSAHAGPGSHKLRFTYNCSGANCEGFRLDDVSLDAAGPDGDGDGTPEASDNCPGVSNPDQANADGDALGDACDDDDDADQLLDGVDQCPTQQGPPANNGCPVVPPRDADGDGVPDESDVCDNAAGTGTPDGCPNIRRTLGVNYKHNAFRGTLRPAGPCAAGEKVTVFHKKPGKDPKVGNHRTNANGKYVIPAPDNEGTYYAKASPNDETAVGHCLKARSKNLNLG